MPVKTPAEKQEHARRLSFWLTEYIRRNADFRRDCALYERRVACWCEKTGVDLSPYEPLEFYAAAHPEQSHAFVIQKFYTEFVAKHGHAPIPPADLDGSTEILYNIEEGRARKMTKDFQSFWKQLPIGNDDDRPPSWEVWQERHKASLERLHDVFAQNKARLGLRQEQEEARAIGLFLFDLVDGLGLTLPNALCMIRGGCYSPIGSGGTMSADDIKAVFPNLSKSKQGQYDQAWDRLLQGTRRCIMQKKVLPLVNKVKENIP